MADYDLKYTGQQIDALLDAANELKTNGYIYKGVATPSTNPGTPTERVAYLASEPGTYTNFGGIVITSGLYSLTYAGGTWTGTQMQAGSDIEVVQTTGQSTTDVMSQKAVTDELNNVPYTDDSISDADLSVTDELGNAIVQFEDGHIKTKNFDSKQLNAVIDNIDVDDYAIGDNNGKIIVRYRLGHIITKHFDSSYIDYSKLFQSQINPFGVSASRYFLRAGKRAYYRAYSPLIIVAGQSNADGRIIYTSAPSWLANNNYKIDNYKVWDTNTNTFQTYDVLGMTGNGGATAGSDGTGENKYAFDAQFAHDWLSEYGGELYLVRQTLGGIGIEDEPTTGTRNWTWQPDIDNIVSGCNSMCLALMNKVLNAMSYARQQGIFLVPLCILWHQGEHDATSEYVSSYKQNLSNLIMWMRGLLLTPTLPFICAYINNNYNEYYHQVNEIFSELATADEYMTAIDMAGHYTMLDNFHYDADAIAYMGNEMFNSIKNYI